MKFDWRLLTVLILTLGLFWGCESDDGDDDATAFELLTEYMADNAMDSPDIIASWIIGADAVYGSEDDYFIVDIRSAEVYATGHVPGAVNSSYAEVVATVQDENTDDKPVVVVCYTGQSAAHAVVALRLSGYTDAKTMKFGMSAWHSDFDLWTGNIGNIAVGHDNWSTAAAPSLPTGMDDPVIETTQTDGAAILAERVDFILAGFKGITSADVLAAPENYQIINYWAVDDWNLYGHIDGAYQVTPNTLTIADDMINMLDPEATVVTYCWTGQTSSMMTAWLLALGYDAKSLKFGVNSMIYDELEGHKWSASFDYTYE